LGESPDSEGAVEFDTVKMMTHPKYRTGSGGVPMDDISIWLLRETANPLNRTMALGIWYIPIHLIRRATEAEEPTGDEPVRVIGWGTTREGGSLSNILLQVDVPIVSNKDCAAAYSSYPNSSHDFSLCAGEKNGGKDACQGDSGGPLFREVDGQSVIYGITSWVWNSCVLLRFREGGVREKGIRECIHVLDIMGLGSNRLLMRTRRKIRKYIELESLCLGRPASGSIKL
jgi:hypothetical protein